MKRYRLRWRYDFATRPSKFGIWDNPGQLDQDKPSRNVCEGPINVAIEGKDPVTKEIIVLAACTGREFEAIQYIAIARVPGMFRGTVKPLTQLVGMKIVTKQKNLEVYLNGQTKILDRPASEKKINFAAY